MILEVMPNLYEILELDCNASQEDIRKSFRRLAAVHHPDKNPGNDQSVQKFKTINDAYQVLSDDKKRNEYDLALSLQNQRNRSRPSPTTNYQSIMDSLYDTFTNKKTVDFGFQNKYVKTHNPGDDITIELFISLDESIAGCKKTIKTKSPRPSVLCSVCHGSGSQPGTRRTTCNSCAGHGQRIDLENIGRINIKSCVVCRGTGTVSLVNCRNCSGTGKSHHEKELTITIPAGIDEGQQLRLHAAGSPGEPAGDLYISIKIKPNNVFRRDKFDIHTNQVIDLNKAIFGGSFSFNGPNNQSIQIEIPPGTQPGDLILVRSAGVQNPNNRIRGNMIVHVNIKLPKVMSNRAKKLWGELLEELGDYNQS